MRRLMWFALGFGGACFLGTSIFWGQKLLPLTLYFAVIRVICFGLSKINNLFRISAVITLGVAAGLCWFMGFRQLYLEPVSALDGETVSLSVTAADYSEDTDYGVSVEAFVSLNGVPYRARVYMNQHSEVAPGDKIEGLFRFRLTTPGGKKESSYYQGNGSYLVASLKGNAQIIPGEKMPIWCAPAYVSGHIRNALERLFPEDTMAFAKALLLGDTSDLSYSEDTALKISGIRHIVAVSGLHVSVVFAVILFLFRRRRWLTFFVSVPALFFFAAMTGFTPSVTRACLMSILMALSMAIYEEYDGLTSLSLACLIMMAVNPFVIYSVSFQLSVSSVAGIMLFSSPVYCWIRKHLPKASPKSWRGRFFAWIAGSFSVTISASIATTPISAYYFGTVSLIGMFTNLLTIWIVGFLFCGIAFVGAFGAVLPNLCGSIAWVISWPIRYVLSIAKLMASIPFAAIYTQSQYVVIWLVFVYFLLLLCFILKRRGVPLLIGAGLASLAAVMVLSIVVPRQDQLRLTVLDVGEGQSILLQSAGEYIMIDCGGDSDTRAADEAAQTLLSQGIFRLDGMAVTHYDRDHVGAVENLLTRIPVDRFYLPSMEGKGLNCPQEQVTKITKTASIPFGNGKITFFPSESQKADNENCMCILFESEECDILITGDRGRSGEKQLISQNSLPDVDVLIAGHHGSKNSTTQQLLQAVKPETVIISVGSGNTYGHPAQELLDRLAEYGCSVYRTDLQGSVLIRR